MSFKFSPTDSAPNETLSSSVGAARGRGQTDSGSVASAASSTKTKVSRVNFPWKLHQMLKECGENEEESLIVNWLPSGLSFRVHDKEEFATKIMPRYFSSNKYKTFQRSLHMWGFQSVTRGPDLGAVQNILFRKDRADLIHMIKRSPQFAKSHRDRDSDSRSEAKSAPTSSRTISTFISATSTLTRQSPPSVCPTVASAPAAHSAFSSQPSPDFASILYAMLDYGKASGVEWETDGRGFRIVNASLHSDQFYEKLRAHNVTKDLFGVYRHDFLIRGQPQLCRHIRPVAVASSSSVASRASRASSSSHTIVPSLPSLNRGQSSLMAALQASASTNRSSSSVSSASTMGPPSSSVTATSPSPLQQFLRQRTRPSPLPSVVPPAVASVTAPVVPQQLPTNSLQSSSSPPGQVGDDSSFILMAMMSILKERQN